MGIGVGMAFILVSESKRDQGKQWFRFIIPDLDSCPNFSPTNQSFHHRQGEHPVFLKLYTPNSCWPHAGRPGKTCGSDSKHGFYHRDDLSCLEEIEI